jgi:hypothetical protein
MFGTGVAASIVATHPAAAASALEAVRATITCATTGTTPCETFNNTSSGIGVLGTSVSGTGVRASSKSGTSMKSTSTTGEAIYGASTSNHGVYGQSTSNSAIFGQSASSYGTVGESTTAYGVFGQSGSNTAAGVAGTTPAGDGVYGYTSAASGGIGVYGTSANGYGTYGSTTTGEGYGVVGEVSNGGVGVYGGTYSGDGVDAATTSGYGVFDEAFGSGYGMEILTGSGYGLISETDGNVPVYTRNAAGNGSDIEGTYIGLLGRAPASVKGFPLTLTDSDGDDLFFVNGLGDVYYAGSLNGFARTANGATVTAFSAKTTAPTVEDTGTAKLVAGEAAVRFDPAFAASIEAPDSYRVFLTADGDTRGLFVASKTPAGFVVRESQGGRSTVSFDYRVVATSLGQTGRRMSFTTAAAIGVPHAPLPFVRTPHRLARALPRTPR